MLDDVVPIMTVVGVSSKRVEAFGRSVGSIYAIELAHRFPGIAWLILGNHAWAGSGNKRLVRFPDGDHNTILAANASEYIVQVRRFLLDAHPD